MQSTCDNCIILLSCTVKVFMPLVLYSLACTCMQINGDMCSNLRKCLKNALFLKNAWTFIIYYNIDTFRYFTRIQNKINLDILHGYRTNIIHLLIIKIIMSIILRIRPEEDKILEAKCEERILKKKCHNRPREPKMQNQQLLKRNGFKKFKL